MRIRMFEPEPVSRQQLALAHDREYVDGVLDCLISNGFRGRQADVAASLPWTTGSFLTAARLALSNARVACSPTSGFHHAGYRSGYGYCTFNGLLVAAMVLKNEGLVSRIGILDCDQHLGDGTSEILVELGIDWIEHISREYGDEYSNSVDAERFLGMLPGWVQSFAGCDLLFYQAGGDQHQDDPLGGFLSTDQLLERDRIVFAEANAMHLPIVWNLAGGYQIPHEKIIEIHRNTMQACIDEYLGAANE